MQASYPLCDLTLSRRLERAEARSNAEFVDARRAAFPDSDACWIEVAGACAMFDGVSSPCTQTFGLGMFATPTAGDMERIEGYGRKGRRNKPLRPLNHVVRWWRCSMTEQQRQQRAAFIREQPVLWLLLIYATAFLAGSVAIDGMRLLWDVAPSSGVQRYLLPLVIVLPQWLGMWGWARRMVSGPGR